MTRAVSFTQGPVGRQLYRLAIPGVWGLLGTLSFNAADTFFVGQLGRGPLAAMTFTFPVVLVVACMGIGLATGASSLVARQQGRGDREQARKSASDALILSLLLSLLFMVAGMLMNDWIFRLLGAGPELLPLIQSYMSIWYLNVPLMTLTIVNAALLQASGHNSTAGLLMVIAAACNIVLDPLLIFGLGPVPRMEIAGAAWATLATRLLQLVIGFYFLASRLRLLGRPHRALGDIWRSWLLLLHVGLPSMASSMVMPLVSGITLWLVALHGADAVAALGVVQRVEPLVLIPFIALSGVMGPFMGQNMEPAYRHRQWRAVMICLRFGAVYTLVMALLLWWFGPFIGRAFSDAPGVIEVVALYFVIVPISYCLSGLGICTTACFNGLGRPLPGMVISLLRSLAFYVPLALLGQRLWGLPGLFLATAITNVLTGAIGYLWLRRLLHRSHRESTI